MTTTHIWRGVVTSTCPSQANGDSLPQIWVFQGSSSKKNWACAASSDRSSSTSPWRVNSASMVPFQLVTPTMQTDGWSVGGQSVTAIVSVSPLVLVLVLVLVLCRSRSRSPG